MSKRIFSSVGFLYLCVFASLPSLADTSPAVALQCQNAGGNVQTSISLNSDKSLLLNEVGQNQNYMTHQMMTTTQTTTINLLATTSLGFHFGALSGKDPVAAFVNLASPGNSYLSVAINADTGATTSTHAANYVINYGSRDVVCTEGPAYPALAKMIAAAPQMTSDGVKEYWDSSLALHCQSSANDVYLVRAMTFSFANIDLQVADAANSMGSRMSFSQFINQGSSILFNGGNAGTAFILNKLPVSVNNSNVYSAELDTTSQKIQLTCQERWAMKNIFTPLAQQAGLATSFPNPLGTTKNLDTTLCSQDAMTRVTNIQGKYQELMQKVPGFAGDGITTVDATTYPAGQKCNALNIFVNSNTDIKAVESIIGDSLDGLFVFYTHMDPISI